MDIFVVVIRKIKYYIKRGLKALKIISKKYY